MFDTTNTHTINHEEAKAHLQRKKPKNRQPTKEGKTFYDVRIDWSSKRRKNNQGFIAFFFILLY